MRIQLSIRRRLLITFILLSVVPLFLLGAVISLYGFWEYQDQLVDLQEELTAQVASSLLTHLQAQDQKLTALVRSASLGNMSREEITELLALFMVSSRDFRYGHVFNEVTFLDRQGKEFAKVSRTRLITRSELADRAAADEFVFPSRTREIFYTPIYFAEKTGEPLMRVSIPVQNFADQNFQGVLTAELHLLFMGELVGNLKIGEKGISFIVDHLDRIVAHPNSSLVLKGTRFKPALEPQILQTAEGGYAVFTAKTVHFGSQALTVVTRMPITEMYSHLDQNFILTGIVLLLALAAALGFGYIIVRQIVQPIESLAGTVKQIENGDLSQRAHLDRADELGDLARSFNAMTARLVNLIKASKQESTRLKNAIDSLTHPFYIIDAHDYTIKLANKAAHFGELTANSKCYALTHHSSTPCNTAEHPCPVREVKKLNRAVVVEHLHYNSIDDAKFFEVHGYPIFDEHGEVAQVIEYSIDVTDKKLSEKQLWEAREAGMAEIAAEVLHNIGNSITPAHIIALDIEKRLRQSSFSASLAKALDEFCTLFQEVPSLPRDEKNRLQKIAELLPQYIKEEWDTCLAGVQKICDKHEYIENIINLQSKYSRLPGYFETVDLNHIADDALQLLADSLQSHGLRIIRDYADLAKIKAERGKLLDVVITLVKNGMEATETQAAADRTLTISTGLGEQAKTVWLSVKDNGCGLDQDEMARLFSFGYTTKKTGIGVGLHSSANYLKAAGGAIHAKSDGPGKGAEFIIHLPVQSEKSGSWNDQIRSE